jgi:hypothetical protein
VWPRCYPAARETPDKEGSKMTDRVWTLKAFLEELDIF